MSKPLAESLRSADNAHRIFGDSVMSSHICLRVHFIWSTAKRTPTLDLQWHPRLFAYMGTILNDHDGKLLAAGGMPDHVHLYTSLPATISLAEITNALKANSSRWLKETFNAKAFVWQKGYGAFSVSPSADRQVRAYVLGQEKHHKGVTFQEEYIAFLKRHEVEYDNRYAFD